MKDILQGQPCVRHPDGLIKIICCYVPSRVIVPRMVVRAGPSVSTLVRSSCGFLGLLCSVSKIFSGG